MNAYRAKPLTYPWPPFLYMAAFAGAVALGRMLPIAIVHDHGWFPWLSGCALIAVAACLDAWAVKTLIERRTAVLPHRCSSHLVTCGPYYFTRNPIYLGYTLMMVGFGLITLNPWFFIMAIVAVALMTMFAIRNEERHLLSRFGFEFERYCRTTSRWI
ncbi:isoprenylcysteine carboxylmethyltransferase family protein [Rhizobium sp. LjRoot98]|uniref:methyltransferase family protein n=1 Tax=unclassified Rhizobium TaxID=2613769 RepID=UPI00071406C1|nr:MULTISPECIES: isoprenylcysteine carboxylmethyltransferase family protein [unclassified Rhizobium]KQV30922.1 isoprenylcysteine carboxyl methyltransferase [Rhizobium sp. Root1204]KQY11070.1 isoprenylcysteine carboxyl methyltransferase [Rhizobium sp. Root1334]KRC05051.1 isoprenylcysteine carboxyl methyltransferase [Rhizobium sp. Root73]